MQRKKKHVIWDVTTPIYDKLKSLFSQGTHRNKKGNKPKSCTYEECIEVTTKQTPIIFLVLIKKSNMFYNIFLYLRPVRTGNFCENPKPGSPISTKKFVSHRLYNIYRSQNDCIVYTDTRIHGWNFGFRRWEPQKIL